MAVELLVFLAVIVGGVVVVRRYPAEAQAFLDWVLTWRRRVVGGFLLAFALVLIFFTGIWYLILLGALILALIWLWILLFTDLEADPREWV